MWLLSLALPALAVPYFVEDPAGLPSPQPCASDTDTTEGCYTNQAQLADLDGDGDLDIVFANGGGYYVPGDAEPLGVYRNDGGAFTYVTDDAFGGFTGRVRQVAIGDIDSDGDLDVVVPDGYAQQADAVFVNDAGVFTNDPTRLGTTSRAGATRMADVDDDGDLDLFISDWGDAPPTSAGVGHLYLNEGTGYFTESAGAIPADLSPTGTGPIDADFFDMDADNDLDLVIASREGDSLLLVNDGAGVYTDAGGQLPAQGGPYVYGPDACDVDGDDDIDLWLDGGSRNGLEQLMINQGDGTFSDQTNARVDGNPAADDNEVQCADVDQDGDMDAVIASLSDTERVLENDGEGNFGLVDGTFTDAEGGTISDSTLGMAIGDLDGDSVLDAVTGQGESGQDFLNKVYWGQGAADGQAPTIRHFTLFSNQLAESTELFHFAVQDGVTSEVGPVLQKAYVQYDGAALDAAWMGGDLYRAELELTDGAHTLQACAIDVAGNETCSLEASFSVGEMKDGCGCASGGPSAGSVLLLALSVVGVSRRAARSTK